MKPGETVAATVDVTTPGEIDNAGTPAPVTTSFALTLAAVSNQAPDTLFFFDEVGTARDVVEPQSAPATETVELQAPIGLWDLTVSPDASSTGGGSPAVVRGVVVVPAITFGPVELPPAVDLCLDDEGERDCDHDGRLSLPLPDPLSADINSIKALYSACAPTCIAAFGPELVDATCEVDGQVFDCDDDADGQADVTEPLACLGAANGTDRNGNGLCEQSQDAAEPPYASLPVFPTNAAPGTDGPGPNLPDGGVGGRARYALVARDELVFAIDTRSDICERIPCDRGLQASYRIEALGFDAADALTVTATFHYELAASDIAADDVAELFLSRAVPFDVVNGEPQTGTTNFRTDVAPTDQLTTLGFPFFLVDTEAANGGAAFASAAAAFRQRMLEIDPLAEVTTDSRAGRFEAFLGDGSRAHQIRADVHPFGFYCTWDEQVADTLSGEVTHSPSDFDGASRKIQVLNGPPSLTRDGVTYVCSCSTGQCQSQQSTCLDPLEPKQAPFFCGT